MSISKNHSLSPSLATIKGAGTTDTGKITSRGSSSLCRGTHHNFDSKSCWGVENGCTNKKSFVLLAKVCEKHKEMWPNVGVLSLTIGNQTKQDEYRTSNSKLSLSHAE